MAGTVADAVDGCADLATRALAALRQQGLAREDARTTSLSVKDFFDQDERRVTARVAGYRLRVTVGDLDEIGSVLGTLSDVAGDSLQVQALQLTVGDPGALTSEARRRAVHDARRTATELAEAAGVRLGTLISIDGGPTLRSGMPRTGTLAGNPNEGRTPMPVEPGEVTFTSRVTLTYAIVQ